MTKKLITALSLMFCLHCHLVSAAEQSRLYVSEALKVWTRTGPSDEYRLKFQLFAGEPVTLLAENNDTGYAQIRDQKGREAWVKREYLMTEKSKAILLEEAREQIAELKVKIARLEPLQAETQSLKDELARLQVAHQQVLEQNQIYSSRFNREVFFAGGVTVLAGILFGWLFGRSGRKRKSGWS